MTWRTSQTLSSQPAADARQLLLDLFQEKPFSEQELQTNQTLFIRSGSIAKILFVNEIYELILNQPGAIFEFGAYLGATSVLFENFRAIHEPYNHLRRIYAFDTFEGYVKPEEIDEKSEALMEIIDDKTYTTPQGYEMYLRQVMSAHEKNNTMSHISKHQVIKGDILETLPRVLENDDSIVIALVYLDIALYNPTKFALDKCLPFMPSGGVIVLDEFGHPDYPGETRAFFEALASRKYSIRNSRFLRDRTIVTLF
jgi:hypothetical protein